MSSRSCARAWCGTGPPVWCALAKGRRSSRSATAARFPTAASMASSSPAPKKERGELASSTRRWCSRRKRVTYSSSAHRAGASKRSRPTASSSRPHPACRGECRSGTARTPVDHSSSGARSARSRGACVRCRPTTRWPSCRPSTRWPRALPEIFFSTSEIRKPRRARCPTTRRSLSSAISTTWATGACASSVISARRCTRPGRWRSAR